MPDPPIGVDPTADEARRQGEEYEGADTLGEGKRVNTARLSRRFREMVESDEDV